MMYAGVIIDISAEAIDRPFYYRIPEDLIESVRPGKRVVVPFGQGNVKRKAYVVDLRDTVPVETEKVKEIIEVDKKAQPVDGKLIELAYFMANEYGSTLNQALMTALPVKRCVRKNSRRSDPVCRMEETDQFTVRDENLTPLQQKVTQQILEEKDRPVLLYGITGSGKTRVYIELIRHMQKQGKQSIVLIPEISLTYQTVNELTAHLGMRVAVMHSRLSEGERFEQYEKCRNNEIDVMVGPRSALFAPFANLGLIIIDEEHEKAYTSDTSPRYDAREVARFRAGQDSAMLVLGSATPSLESYKKASEGEYALCEMKTRAVEGASLPVIKIADMRDELRNGNRSMFSVDLYDAVKDRLAKKQQTMLFLNRRGYAGFVSCRSCGTVVKCPHCDVSLTAHNSWFFDKNVMNKKSALLSCHYCGYQTAMPTKCPDCSSGLIAPFGTGTEKLELAVKREFPEARVLRMDADTTSVKDGHETILSKFRRQEADILIGTQMIVKGHDFPNVTLVGIVAADQSLNVPDYEAAERTYQLLTQAAGRAGRADNQGLVVIQSYEPEHYAIQMAASRNYEDFFEREISFRHLMNYPPETGLLSIRFSCEQEILLSNAAKVVAEQLTESGKYEGAVVIGPCNAGVYKVKDIFRKFIYIKHPSRKVLLRLRQQAGDYLKKLPGSSRIYLNYDIK